MDKAVNSCKKLITQRSNPSEEESCLPISYIQDSRYRSISCYSHWWNLLLFEEIAAQKVFKLCFFFENEGFEPIGNV